MDSIEGLLQLLTNFTLAAIFAFVWLDERKRHDSTRLDWQGRYDALDREYKQYLHEGRVIAHYGEDATHPRSKTRRLPPISDELKEQYEQEREML